ncbi:helix-turn-helix transcriptional regulator [Candidatus Pacearchaeota archaeon]|nr:helix-turn-helix transcriptional regulator [Candidatus Pacearchaeota archaeon]
MSEIATMLKLARLEKELNQQQLSKLAKVYQGSISKYETGMQMPRAGELVRLARVLEIDFGELAQLIEEDE